MSDRGKRKFFMAKLERTFVVFEPECEEKHITFARILFEKKSISEVASRIIKLTPQIIQKVHSRYGGYMLDAAYDHLNNHHVMALCLEGTDAIKRVRTIVGPQMNEVLDAPECLRARFISWEPTKHPRVRTLPHGTYVRKYIHRPSSEEEVRQQLPVLFGEGMLQVAQVAQIVT
ncbi:MAG: nucleoside-diphosphate kinase [bacterium]|nr:nucleoside-diphosphate kinase [bacterium]